MKKYSFIPPCSRPLRLRDQFGVNTDKSVGSASAFAFLIRSNASVIARKRRQAIAALAGLLFLGGLTSCSSSESTNAGTTTVRQETNLLATATLDTAHLENAQNELDLTGKITFNQDQVIKVFPLVGGHIDAIKADLGDFVKKGQTLAIIRSGDLADLEQQSITARGQLSIAQKNLQVTQDMANAGLNSQRDLVASKEQLQAAQGEVRRVNERRQILGGSGSAYVVKAPMSGFIVEKTASPGMELRPDDPESLFTISNLARVWVLANVYESDLANVHEGDPADITTLSYPNTIFHGRIDKIFNVLDPDSKTLKVRVTLDNADYRLKPEMFANVSVTYAGHDQRVAIPARAVVFDKNRNFVVAINQNKQPVVREVNIYKTVGQKTYLSDGLTAGDRVVTNNQLLIYNALGN
ncbi:efflux RND transporter periplasmic adaptor subunit [Spirosoma taeanense]|uniref:Efflux RND transporter periplasmic adaptor subunit n=1 Tax=Spirosoma taeanense TaxID=2735870 RepID=A0A6M5Y5D9_9BACT|nr:efflux RND transporter periplasmic adaptor subunit [Spirosoma taeanense]QJW89039.1 efflux RND transporter periplasmic adaptor subunit [Spirosoma taeanense]